MVIAVLTGMLIVGCTNQPPEPAPTETQEEVSPTNTAPAPNTPTPTLPPPTPTETPEINETVELDFVSLEGIQIYYSTYAGIESLVLPCGTGNTPCSESHELVDFSQMTTFNQIDGISLFPGEDQFVFHSGDYSHNGSDDIFAYVFETGFSERLTDTSDYNDTAWLSPDGETLAVVADRNGGGHSYLHTIGQDGCCLTTIPNQLTYDQSPAWSPGGGQIAFFSENRTQAKLFLYTLHNKEVKEIFPNSSMKKSGTAVWSPDGQKLAFVATFDHGVDICIVNFLTNDSDCLAENKLIERLPAWSTDSTSLIYSAFDIESGSEDIYQINADGTARTQITSTGTYHNPEWLNDSFFICETQNLGAGQIILLSFDGTWVQPITTQAGGASLLKIVFP